MLVRTWQKRNTVVEIGTATMESSMKIPQRTWNYCMTQLFYF